jgi:hypothetical protein
VRIYLDRTPRQSRQDLTASGAVYRETTTILEAESTQVNSRSPEVPSQQVHRDKGRQRVTSTRGGYVKGSYCAQIRGSVHNQGYERTMTHHSLRSAANSGAAPVEAS